MYKLALLSFWHVHAKDYARDAERHPETEIIAAWDELPGRGAKLAAERGWRFHESLDELLADQQIDGVIVTTPTNMHREVMVAAAQAGKHIFTEKVLAAETPDAEAIVTAAQQARIKLIVSLPRLYHGYTRAISELLAAGELGEPTQVRVRLAHDGALRSDTNPDGWLPLHFYEPRETLGGALIDLGCHPAYLVRLLLGMPGSVSSSFGYITHRAVEDQATVVYRYGGGAAGIVETGFVSPGAPFTIEAHGTAGSLLFGTPEARLLVRQTTVRRSGEWREVAVPPDGPSAFEQWVDHIKRDTIASENIAMALDLTRIMEAAYHSAQTGTSVLL